VGAWALGCACAGVALLIQHATRSHTVICNLSGSTIFFNIIYLTNGIIFWGKKLLNMKWVFWFSLQLSFEILLILRRIQWDIVTNGKSLLVKYLLFFSDFHETWIFSTDFRKNSNIKFRQNPSSGGRVVPCRQTDRQTDMTKLTVAFRNFSNAPKKKSRSPELLTHLGKNRDIFYSPRIRNARFWLINKPIEMQHLGL
jgi:hypothetical protein